MAVDLPYPEEEVPQLLVCTVLSNPASPQDACFVTVPSFASNDRVKVNWEPHRATYPTSGTPGVIMRDDAGQWWLMMWVGGWS